MKKILFAAMILGLMATGCGTNSYITSSWKAKNVQPRQYKKVLVLGLIGGEDRSLRERMEQHLVEDLKTLGYDAICSCQEYEPRAFERMSEKEAIAKLSNSGIDAVLTIVLLDKKKEKNYYKVRMSDVTGRYQDQFWRYYTTMRERIYAPDYYSIDTKYFWESNFYDLTSSQNEILYSAQSQSFDPASNESLGHEYGVMIFNDMVKNNILGDQRIKKLKPM